jgi:2-phosphosulfolactate phosphatase
MKWHFIEGVAGCVYAKEHGCTAVIVDALRASATAAMLLDAGAVELVLVPDVETAFRAKAAHPDALLYGERGGVPPEGFDYGNSPRECSPAAGKRVVFTTTNGTALALVAWGAPDVILGTTVNATAVVQHVLAQERDAVLIPAGKVSDAAYSAQEDWTAAAAIAMLADVEVGEGVVEYREWQHLIGLDGVARLFASAPHAEELRRVGMDEDIAYCARRDLTGAVPEIIERNEYGLVVRNAHGD